MAKRKRTNKDLQIITHKTKVQVARTPLKQGLNSGAPEGKEAPAQLMASVVLLYLEIKHSQQLSLIKMEMLTPPEHLVSIPLSWEHIVWDFFLSSSISKVCR
jgi:hypothetical protein